MSETHGDGNEHAHHPHHHACANFFGCGDEKGTGLIREDIKDAAFDNRVSDTLLHMDQVDQETLDGYLSARGHWRRKFLQASSFMGALAAVEPWFARLARAQESGAAPKRESHRGGRVQETAPDQCHCVNLPLATREPSTEDIVVCAQCLAFL